MLLLCCCCVVVCCVVVVVVQRVLFVLWCCVVFVCRLLLVCCLLCFVLFLFAVIVCVCLRFVVFVLSCFVFVGFCSVCCGCLLLLFVFVVCCVFGLSVFVLFLWNIIGRGGERANCLYCCELCGACITKSLYRSAGYGSHAGLCSHIGADMQYNTAWRGKGELFVCFVLLGFALFWVGLVSKSIFLLFWRGLA